MNETVTTGRFLTLPNVLSFARLFILLPAALYTLISQQYVPTLVLLAVLGITDWLDGFLARRLNQQSRLGKNLDVIADRVSVVFIGVGLAVSGLIPWWIVAYIAGVDAVVALITWCLYKGAPTIPVSLAGKVRTAAFLVGLPGLLLAAALHSQPVRIAAFVVIAIGLVFHTIAGIGYVIAMLKDRRKL